MNRFKEFRIPLPQNQEAENKIRLDHYLNYFLVKNNILGRDPTKTEIRRWIFQGKVSLGKRILTAPDILLDANSSYAKELILSLEDQEVAPRFNVSFKFEKSWILFEDEFLVAIDKPPGLPTQPTLDPKRQSLYQMLLDTKQFSYVGLHHRLDRDTSGVILFTKDKRANAGIADGFKDRTIKKNYEAIVEGKVLWTEKTHYNYLAKDPQNRGRMRPVKAGGDPAETVFKLIQVSDQVKISHVLASPQTGRMHQIRVHLSELRHPIVGDTTYGEGRDGYTRTMLHARSLTFLHPISRVETSIFAPVPADFKKCLNDFGLSLNNI